MVAVIVVAVGTQAAAAMLLVVGMAEYMLVALTWEALCTAAGILAAVLTSAEIIQGFLMVSVTAV